MEISNLKNIVVLKNLPSNLVEEAIVVLKGNKKIKKYEYVDDIAKRKNETTSEMKRTKREKDNKEYVVKEAEMLIDYYVQKLETKSPKWKNNMKKLEIKYKKSVKLNFILGFSTIISLLISLI